MSEAYIVSRDAKEDIAAIWEYIAFDNPVAADTVLQELYEAMQILGDHPGVGHKREDLTHLPIKFWSVRHYMILYDPQTRPLHILRVISGYRDIEGIIE